MFVVEEPRSEIEVLREQVRVLSAGLGLEGEFHVPADVRAHAEAGRTVEAIRELRRQAPGRLGLIPAKRMIEALRRPPT